MYRYFNKYGNIEVANNSNILKYRIGVEHIETDDIKIIENELKQKFIEIDKDSFIAPINVDFVNRYLVLNYNMQHLSAFDRLREFTLLENIPYFLSLVELGKLYENGHKFTWERLNFVVDIHSKSVKVILVETPNLKVYTDEVDIVKAVKDMIISALTMQTTFIALPKRHDFIDASDENVFFVESMYKMETLEDIELYLETAELDLLNRKTLNDEAASTEDTNSKKSKKSPKKNAKKHTQTKKHINKSNEKKQVKRIDKNTLILFAVIGFIIIIYIANSLSSNKTNETAIAYDAAVEDTFIKDETKADSVSNEIIKAYRAIYNSDVDEAYEIIKNLTTDQIGVDDIQLVIDTYFRSNKSFELLDKYPNLANSYITYLISNGTINQLETFIKGMETENPYIQFELAYLKNNYENVLLYKDQVEMNARRESQIVDAYIQTEQINKALEFAKSTNNPDLITQAENASK